MLKEIASECEVDSAVLNHREVRDVAGDSLNTGDEVVCKTRPRVDSNAPAGHHVVDELSVAGPKIEHACVLRHAISEKRRPQSLPEHVAARVSSKAGLMIMSCHSVRFQPKVSPRIMARPTLRARRLSVFPPLLTPTRG